MAKKGALNRKEQKVVIPLEQSIPEIEGRNAWEIPESHLEKDGRGGYKVVNSRRPSKTLLANNIRKEVDTWRKADYIEHLEASPVVKPVLNADTRWSLLPCVHDSGLTEPDIVS